MSTLLLSHPSQLSPVTRGKREQSAHCVPGTWGGASARRQRPVSHALFMPHSHALLMRTATPLCNGMWEVFVSDGRPAAETKHQHQEAEEKE